MSLRLAIEKLEALRQHLGLEKMTFAGHSWGGMLAMAYAASHPDRVERLILIGSGGPTREFLDYYEDNIGSDSTLERKLEERLLPPHQTFQSPAQQVQQDG